MTFDGGEGIKYINKSETTLITTTTAANPLSSCQRLKPSMNIFPAPHPGAGQWWQAAPADLTERALNLQPQWPMICEDLFRGKISVHSDLDYNGSLTGERGWSEQQVRP
jgi:hypothetical protein